MITHSKFLIPLIFLAFLECPALFAQPGISATDSSLLVRADFQSPSYEKRHVPFIHGKSKNAMIRYNPISLSFGLLMFAYQRGLSVQFSSSCPYEESCSEFSKKLIGRFGIIKGIFLTADRLLRCNAIAANDFTPSTASGDGKVMDNLEKYQWKW